MDIFLGISAVVCCILVLMFSAWALFYVLEHWFVKRTSVSGYVEHVTYTPAHSQMIFNGKFYSQIMIPKKYYVRVSVRTLDGKKLTATITKNCEFFKREEVKAKYIIGRLTKEPKIVDIK